MERLTLGKQLTCQPVGTSYKRMVARCTLPDGRSLSCAAVAAGAATRWDRYWRQYGMEACRQPSDRRAIMLMRVSETYVSSWLGLIIPDDVDLLTGATMITTLSRSAMRNTSRGSRERLVDSASIVAPSATSRRS